MVWITAPIGIILGIIAIVLSTQSTKKFGNTGLAFGAKLCGIFGIVLSALFLILVIAFFIFVFSLSTNLY